jgi:surface antigen
LQRILREVSKQGVKRRYQEICIRDSISVTGTKLATAATTKQNRQAKSRNPTRFSEAIKKHYVKGSILLVNIGLFVGVAVLVSTSGSQSAQPVQSITPSLSAATSATSSSPLDEISSVDIAVNIAKVTALPEINAVRNKADTINAGLAVASADEKIVAKPQIVSEGLKSKRDILEYKTKKGDTVKSVAKKFGIKPDTVRNSNNLEGNTVAVGVKLLISPVDGLVYQVSSGDTPSSIANEYKVDQESLVAINDAELTNKFKVGEYIIIPDGVPQAESNSGSSSTSSYRSVGSFSFGVAPVYRENAYAYGWCTWHAANRRHEIGRPIPSNMGNAISWLSVAQNAGLPTGSKPRAGAVLYHLSPATSLGHVAFVEKVNKNGSFLVSDMNYPIWGTVTYRTVPASETGQYRFIY